MAGYNSEGGAFDNRLWRRHFPIRLGLHPEHTRQPALDSDVVAPDLLNWLNLHRSGQGPSPKSLPGFFSGSCVFLQFCRIYRWQFRTPTSNPQARWAWPSSAFDGGLLLFHSFPQRYQTHYSPHNSLSPLDFRTPHSNQSTPFECQLS